MLVNYSFLEIIIVKKCFALGMNRKKKEVLFVQPLTSLLLDVFKLGNAIK